MDRDAKSFDSIWEVLLSREPVLVSAAYKSLQPDEQAVVREHLQKMVTEPGWQPGQRASAQIALDVIHEGSNN